MSLTFNSYIRLVGSCESVLVYVTWLALNVVCGRIPVCFLTLQARLVLLVLFFFFTFVSARPCIQISFKKANVPYFF